MTGSSPEGEQQPLKILMTSDAVGGVWQYSVDLARGLVQRGAEVLIATMGPRPSKERKQQLLRIPRVALAESYYALEWMPDAWRDVESAGEWLLDLASSFGASVVHLNGYCHGNLPWGKPAVIAAHSCVFSWWSAVHGCAPGEEWSEYKRRVKEGLLGADVAICPSQYMGTVMADEYGVTSEKIRVIHNFSRAARFEAKEKQEFFLAAGRMWDQAKNLALLERIAPELKWQIRVAGSGGDPEDSNAAAKSVRFLGVLAHPELLSEMERASIFVHPALYEPFGLSVLEAARRRCCLVLSDIPSLRELWTDAAIFINPRNPERWISELNRLAAQPLEREAMAQLAFSRAGKFRADSAVATYREVYSSLLNARKEVAA